MIGEEKQSLAATNTVILRKRRREIEWNEKLKKSKLRKSSAGGRAMRVVFTRNEEPVRIAKRIRREKKRNTA